METLQLKRNWIAEYSKLKACIPSLWKNVLKEEADIILNGAMLHLLINHQEICFKNKVINYKKVKQKELYFKCLYTQPPPSSKAYWENIFGTISALIIPKHFPNTPDDIIGRPAVPAS